MAPSKTARKTLKKTAAKKAPAKKAPAKKAAAVESGFDAVFAALRGLMARHGAALVVKADAPGNYYVNSPKPYNKRDLFFGAVQTKKSYVSYHFFPLYMFPELAKNLSPELKKRRQGKACFNFSSVDEGLFQELGAFTERGFEEFRRRELL